MKNLLFLTKKQTFNYDIAISDYILAGNNINLNLDQQQ